MTRRKRTRNTRSARVGSTTVDRTALMDIIITITDLMEVDITNTTSAVAQVAQVARAAVAAILIR